MGYPLPQMDSLLLGKETNHLRGARVLEATWVMNPDVPGGTPMCFLSPQLDRERREHPMENCDSYSWLV